MTQTDETETLPSNNVKILKRTSSPIEVMNLVKAHIQCDCNSLGVTTYRVIYLSCYLKVT